MAEAVETTKEEAPPPAVEDKGKVPAQDPKGDRVEAAVRQWVREHLANSPFSRNTPAWNHLQSKIGALVEAIKKEV